MLAFQPSADDNWVLGTSFLRNYYSVWDHDNSRVGLAIHRTSTAQINSYTFMPLPIETIDNKSRKMEHHAGEFMLAGAIIAGQLGLQGVIFAGVGIAGVVVAIVYGLRGNPRGATLTDAFTVEFWDQLLNDFTEIVHSYI